MSGNLLQQMYNIPTHGWQVAFFREITLIDNGLTDDPENLSQRSESRFKGSGKHDCIEFVNKKPQYR